MLSGTNKKMITTVAKALSHLAEQMVFVGGSVTELYIPEGIDVAEVRQTDDVDCIIELSGRMGFSELETTLRGLNFSHNKEVICRWHFEDIIVDVMPTDENILGFSNRWYREGIHHASAYLLDDGMSISILPVEWFIACKLEALFSRGMSDMRLSKDLEDIVFLLNYLPDIVAVINVSTTNVKIFIQESFAKLLDHPDLDEAIFCVLPSGENEPDNVDMIKNQITDIVAS